jgi:hypothetical protein
MQVSTEKRGFVRFFLLGFLLDMYVCLMAHMHNETGEIRITV